MSKKMSSNLTLLILMIIGLGVGANLKSKFVVAGEPVTGSDDGYAALVVGVPFEAIQGFLGAGAANVIYGNSSGLNSDGNQIWHQNILGMLDGIDGFEKFGSALTAGDFDGNGYSDLALSVPSETVNGNSQAGAVHVIYGTANGLEVAGNQFWHQNSLGISGAAEANDSFGFALTAGDFDGDGYDDLVVGVIGEDIGVSGQGAVNVIYGSMDGLTAIGDQFWHQDSTGILEIAEENDVFGWALTAGDFNNDGKDDLAVGVPGEDIGSIGNAGAINIIYGSNNGLDALGNQVWHQDSGVVLDSAEQDDSFGQSLKAGDFDNDGFVDLAIGVPGESINGISRAGAVNVLYGTVFELADPGNQFWHQGSPGIPGGLETFDFFGYSLETADFDADGFFDLVIGVINEEIGGESQAGALHVLYGSNNGLNETGTQLWHQASPGILDDVEEDDQFSSALAGCDFNGDGFSDLAVGVFREDIGGFTDAGAVNVIYGTSNGLSEVGNQFWHQDSPGILDDVEAGDRFGSSLACMSGGFGRVYMPGVFRP